ncbi:uncharacterized protein [Anabrus simplex]|uniref:uncharacterized protein n=1 Tax=Anabrus simplex TaxID=316456 RepID=UPI0035A2DF72
MKCKVETCCCGCSLKTGSYLIGLIQAVLSGILLVFCILTIVGAAALTDDDFPDNIRDDEAIIDTIKKMFIVVASISAVLVAIHMFFGVLLAYGTKKEKADLIKAWIMYSIVYLVLYDVLQLIHCVSSFVYGQTTEGVQSLLTIIAATALQSYFIVVVKSYYETLTHGKQPVP